MNEYKVFRVTMKWLFKLKGIFDIRWVNMLRKIGTSKIYARRGVSLMSDKIIVRVKIRRFLQIDIHLIKKKKNKQIM